MKLIFDTHGNEKQKECARAWLDPIITDIIYGGSKGSGKSFLGINLIFGDAFLYPETHYFIARNQLNDLRRFTIPSIMEVFGLWGIDRSLWRINGQDNYFELYNQSRVYLLDAKHMPSDPLYQRFGSMQMTRGWIEEAGEFDINAKQNLQASIGRWKNKEHGLTPKLLQTCNPAKNYLYTDYYRKWKDGELEGHKKFIQALPTDNKMLPDGYLENLEKTLDTVSKERLLFGNWEYDDDPNALIEYDAIIDLFTNTVPEGEKWITADIARFGMDKTVIAIWNGYRVEDIIYYEKQDLAETAERIKGLAESWQVPRSHIVVDEDGIGGGVKDILKCKGFIANTRPQKDENYQNLKTQCYYRLANKVNAREISINCQDTRVRDWIIEELEQVKSDKVDNDRKVCMVSKDKVKKMIGRSPDFSDTLAMRMWEAPKFGFGVSLQ